MHTALGQQSTGLSIQQKTDHRGRSDIEGQEIPLLKRCDTLTEADAFMQNAKGRILRKYHGHIPVNDRLTGKNFSAVYNNFAFAAFPVAAAWRIRIDAAFYQRM